LVIISAFLLIINFIPIFLINEGITTPFSDNISTDRQTFVNKSNPDFNYNIYEDEAFIGNSCETYIHYNLELLPEETEESFFFISSISVLDIEINLILVGSNWSSSEITWNNKPKHEEIIDTVNASEIRQSPFREYYNFEETINLTRLIKNNHLTEISFCINITENNVELNDSVFLYGMQLMWKYEKLLLSYTTIITSIIISFMLIGTIIYNHRGVYSCPSCKSKSKVIDKICLSCRNKFKEDFLIKNADYQSSLIILWIFALFEGSFLIWGVQMAYKTYRIMYIAFFIFLIINWIVFCSIQLNFKINKYKRIRDILKFITITD
jgi:hypothetical protein